MSKGVTFRPIHTAHKSATMLGFRNTALMIEGLEERAGVLNFMSPPAERKKDSDAVLARISCIRSALENERSEYDKNPPEWFGWTRMNVFLGETLKGTGVAGVITYAGCSAASMFHFTGQNSFSWPMFFTLTAAMAVRAIWKTAGTSREKLMARIDRSLAEIENLAREYEEYE